MKWILPLGLATAFLLYLTKKQIGKSPLPTGPVPTPIVIKTSDVSMRPEHRVSAAIQQAFKNVMLKYAPDIQRRYGIQPNILVAQASLESTYGTSGLAQQGKNLFGMKTGPAWDKAGKPYWQGQTEEYLGGKYNLLVDHFRKYNSWAESIEDWAQLITKTYVTASKYAKAGDLDGYAKALMAFKYTTHPQYADLLNGVATSIA